MSNTVSQAHSPDESSHQVLIVAAEASSVLYAKRVLELLSKNPSRRIEAFGVGSEEMKAHGFEVIGRSEELAIMGVAEVVKHFPLIRKTFYSLLDAAKEKKPDFALLLDYPDFNLRIAKKLKAMGIPVIYYISPQIWAWRTHRVNKMRSLVDKMLVLFPFEKKFYLQNEIDCEFVGHPLLDEISPELFRQEDIQKERSKFGVSANTKLIGLMPGSRSTELNHHLETQLSVAKKMYEQDSSLHFALLVAPSFSKEEIQGRLPEIDFPLILLKDEPFQMIRLVDIVLTASGTATLLVGLMAKPMVIMYKMNPLTAMIAKRFVTNTKYFGMINLIFDSLVVPEFFQDEASVENLSKHLFDLVNDSDLFCSTKDQLGQTFEKLGDRGATSRVVEALEEFWKPL